MDLPDIPDDARTLACSLRSGLDAILDDEFASLFLYGAIAFPRPERWRIDFDFHVLLRRPLTDRDRDVIGALYAELADASELGGDLDGYYVLLAAAERREPPRHQLNLHMRDDAWALHRAHVHAGRYFLISGLDPIEILPEPEWAELEQGLRAEMGFIDEHPEATAFGILNGCRILRSFETRDVVSSKYQAADWALASLPAERHEAVRAASRWYARAAEPGDAVTLEAQHAAFVANVHDVLGAA